MRRTTTIGLIVTGIALMVIGYLASAPWGSASVADADPAFAGAPILFLLGIVAILMAAILYEILPNKRR